MNECLSSSCPLVCAAAICYSPQIRIPEYFIVRVISACVILYPTPSQNSFVFNSFSIFFRSSHLSVEFVFLLWSRTRYASTWFALQRLVFLCLTVTTEFAPGHLCRMKKQERRWGYCWCRWVERRVQCENIIQFKKRCRSGARHGTNKAEER